MLVCVKKINLLKIRQEKGNISVYKTFVKKLLFYDPCLSQVIVLYLTRSEYYVNVKTNSCNGLPCSRYTLLYEVIWEFWLLLGISLANNRKHVQTYWVQFNILDSSHNLRPLKVDLFYKFKWNHYWGIPFPKKYLVHKCPKKIVELDIVTQKPTQTSSGTE